MKVLRWALVGLLLGALAGLMVAQTRTVVVDNTVCGHAVSMVVRGPVLTGGEPDRAVASAWEDGCVARARAVSGTAVGLGLLAGGALGAAVALARRRHLRARNGALDHATKGRAH